MNRTQRALIKQAHKKLAMDRSFKNDALYEKLDSAGFISYNENSRFESENEIFKASKKALRKLKRYNGPTGSMSEENYMEFMGA